MLRTDLLLRSLAPSDTAKLQVQHIELAPNAEAPHHRHNVAILAYVLEGKVQTESEDGSVSTYDVGAAWWQQPGPHVHLVARNASKNARARLLTVFIGEKLPITDAD